MKKVLCVLVLLSLLMGCAKIERDIPEGSKSEEKMYRLYIVGKDDVHNVICYGNVNNSAAISCVKVR
jgi:hypothetical protein